ncbi:MAG: 16S rRNA processing protein RimM [Bacteroidales bacterium]|nr:16S rRNA processing protein RimM [Bacteroidales bacterium]MBN2763772.1 16S rRNA processing protein RimM [Bacteroidales bacterium]
MIDLHNYLPIGIFTRTHGVQGALILRMQALEAEDLPEMGWVFVEVDGLPVPFFVDDIRVLNADKIILTLDSVKTETRAKELVGYKVFIPSKKKSRKVKEKNSLEDIKGYTVIDHVHGKLGEAVDFVMITGNPLLRMLSGEKEILIPAHDDIILEISAKERVIRIRAPEGLIDLY